MRAGITRVVTALTDPDPRVSGKGHALLRAAGIEVTEGVMTAEATRLNAGFLKRVTQGLPFVTLKLATTLDGPHRYGLRGVPLDHRTRGATPRSPFAPYP